MIEREIDSRSRAQTGMTRRQLLEQAARTGIGVAGLAWIGSHGPVAQAQEASVWTEMAGAMAPGRVAVVRDGDGLLAVFMRSDDNTFWYTRQRQPNGVKQAGAIWQDWQKLDGVLLARNPSAIAGDNGDLVVSLVGTNNLPYVLTLRGPDWVQADTEKSGKFTTLPINSNGQPVVIKLGNGQIVTFWRGTNDFLYYRRQTDADNGVWSAATFVSGPYTSSDVAAGLNLDTSTSLFVMASTVAGGTKTLWNSSLGVLANGTLAWTNKSGLGALVSNPAVGRNSNGLLEVFGAGLDNNGASQLYHRRQAATNTLLNLNTDWELAGGSEIAGNVAVAQNADKTLAAFARVKDGTMQYIGQDKPNGALGTWLDVKSGNVEFDSDPVVAANQDGRLELFCRSSTGKLYHTRQDGPNGTFVTP